MGDPNRGDPNRGVRRQQRAASVTLGGDRRWRRAGRWRWGAGGPRRGRPLLFQEEIIIIIIVAAGGAELAAASGGALPRPGPPASPRHGRPSRATGE